MNHFRIYDPFFFGLISGSFYLALEGGPGPFDFYDNKGNPKSH